METLELRSTNGASCKLALNGAHIVSWRTADGDEQLFLSRRTLWENKKPIRGGIPIIFPQFADMGPLLKHGFARSNIWRLHTPFVEESLDHANQPSSICLVLDREDIDLEQKDDANQWDYRFCAELTITLSDSSLDLHLNVTNTDERHIEFQCAFHPYFRTTCRHPEIIGLQSTRYFDKLTGMYGFQRESNSMVITGPIDSIFIESDGDLILKDDLRCVLIHRSGFKDTVVWTPWDGEEGLPDDLAVRDGRSFICVEPANVAEKVQLASGQTWTGQMQLKAETSLCRNKRIR